MTESSTQVDADSKSHEEGKKGPYPKSVFFIVSNEFCERFSYYGMRTVLTIYLSQILLYSDADATSIYHVFAMACYFTPLFGAIIADSWLGKFKTIFYISIIYVIGNVVLSVGAFNFEMNLQRTLSLIGLTLIALGTGGIKPCVAAFGGDQFVKGQEVYLQQFFSIFYICINAGSVISTYVTPKLRQLHCNEQESCFSLAFGVPAVLMLVSLVIFLCGRPFYRCIPPGDNVIVKMGGCIFRASVNKFSGNSSTKEHWLDHADDKYDQKFIDEVKTVLRVLLIYIPVPIFWALFDQQGSTWTLQATRMQWSIGGFEILPDQVQLLNPLFIVLLAPLFSYVIYPAFSKCGLLKKPLQKMIVGGLLAAASFFICMFVQLAVEAQDSNAITLSNALPCEVQASYYYEEKLQNATIRANDGVLKINRPLPEEVNLTTICPNLETATFKIDSSHKASREKIIIFTGSMGLNLTDIPELGKGNLADVKVIFESEPLPIYLEDDSGHKFNFTPIENAPLNLSRLELAPIANKRYTLSGEGFTGCKEETFVAGEGYLYFITPQKTCSLDRTLAKPNLSLAWQAPQYFLMTAGEVMFSVTGLEFSYSQAPTSMKSVLQAGWLMTVAIGNLLVVIVAKMGIQKQSIEFMVFGIAMVVDMAFFAVLAYFYVPIRQATEDTTVVEPNEMCDIRKGETAPSA